MHSVLGLPLPEYATDGGFERIYRLYRTSQLCILGRISDRMTGNPDVILRRRSKGIRRAKARVQFVATCHQNAPSEIVDQASNQIQRPNTCCSHCSTTALVQSRF